VCELYTPATRERPSLRAGAGQSGRRFGFVDAPAALRHLQSGESIGKIVLEV